MATRRVSRVSTEHYTRKIKGGDVVTTTSNLNPTQDINQFNNAFNQLTSSTTSIPSTESVINPTEDINQINNVFNQLTAPTNTATLSDANPGNFTEQIPLPISTSIGFPGETPIIWLDPTAIETLLEGNTGIVDKSYSGNNATFTNVTTTPVNGIVGLELSQSSIVQGTLATPLTSVSTLTSFVVCKILNNSTSNGVILSFNDGTSQNDYDNTTSLSALTLSGTPDGFGTYYGDADDVYSPIVLHNPGEHPYNLLYNKFSLATNTITNGKDTVLYEQPFLSSIVPSPLTIASYSIGNQGIAGANSEDTIHGVICEVLVFNYDMPESDRKYVEDYLGKKWGLPYATTATDADTGADTLQKSSSVSATSNIINETGVLYWTCYWANQYIKIHNGALLLAKSNPTNVEGYTTFVSPASGATIPLIENIYAWVKVWHTNLNSLLEKDGAPPNISTHFNNATIILEFIKSELAVAKDAQAAGNWNAESKSAVDIGKLIDSHIIESSYTPQSWLNELENSYGAHVLGKAFAALDAINGKKIAVDQGKELMATTDALLVWNP